MKCKMHSIFHYKIKVPEQSNNDSKYPLLIALHGVGDHEQYMIDLFDRIANKFIVIAPRGNLSHEAGFAYYRLKDYGKPDIDSFDQSMEQLQMFIKKAIETYSV